MIRSQLFDLHHFSTLSRIYSFIICYKFYNALRIYSCITCIEFLQRCDTSDFVRVGDVGFDFKEARRDVYGIFILKNQK